MVEAMGDEHDGAGSERLFFEAFGPECPWLTATVQGKTWRGITGRAEKAPDLGALKVRLEVRRIGGKGWSVVEPADAWKVAEVSRPALLERFGGGRMWRASLRWKGNTLKGSTVHLGLERDPTPPCAIPGDVLDAALAAPLEENAVLRAELNRTHARLAAAEKILKAPAPSPEVARDVATALRAREALQRENLRLWVSITGGLQKENDLLRGELDRVNARLAAMEPSRIEGERAA